MESNNRWIKLSTTLLDDENLFMIENQADGPALCWLWVKMLALAGKINRCGNICLGQEISYDESLLASRLRVSLPLLQQGLKMFEGLGMISLKNGMTKIADWEHYQNLQSDDEYREKSRERKRRERERKQREKAMECGGAAMSLAPVPQTLIDAEGLEGLSPEDAHRIQEEHNEMLNLAQSIGLATTSWDFEEIVRLYGLYGKEKLEYALREAAGQRKLSMKYVEAVCRNYGSAKAAPGYRDESIPDWN